MSSDINALFLTYYIRSLAERTRVEKKSTKFGFDWIIYNLALVDDLIPYRLPFIRSGPDDISKTKTEPELGIDFSFLSPDKQTLTIFVLKDEVLCNSKWTTCDFDCDLRKAAAPDLTPTEFHEVKKIKIILSYNKDEDQTGIQLFNNLTKTLGTKVGDNVALSFERWNLSTITELVKNKLLTPSLLPQRFFSLFSYICSQFADFRHGSDEWEKQLIPNWQRFLDDVLKDNADERSIRLLPVALIILKSYGSNNPSSETGWIDLAEWAMLAAWQVYRTTQSNTVKSVITQMWASFYLAEIDIFYNSHSKELATEHCLETRGLGSYIDSVASSVVAFWHIARIGMLSLGYAEIFQGKTEKEKKEEDIILNNIANLMVSFINANPSAMRPLLDIHHIELFLIWHSLWQVGRTGDIYKWLCSLGKRFFVRRTGRVPIPFIEGSNSLELVFEYVATNQKPPEYCDQSSLLLLFLLEICFSLELGKRNELLLLFYRQIVLAQDINGRQFTNCTSIDLMGWLPPEGWIERILSQSLAGEGECITLETFKLPVGSDGEPIAQWIKDYITKSRVAKHFKFPEDFPFTAIVLACLKHKTPLLPEFWRIPIFGPVEQSNQSEKDGMI